MSISGYRTPIGDIAQIGFDKNDDRQPFISRRKGWLFLRHKKSKKKQKGYCMETRVALIGIMVENADSVEQLNHLLHEYGRYIIGRMGIPYQERGINIISVAIDAPQDAINALSGKIGRLNGISAKTVYSNLPETK